MANIGSVTFQKDERSTYEHMLAYTIGSAAVIGVVLWFVFRLALGSEGAIWGVVVAVAAGVGLFWQYSANFPEKTLTQIRQAAAQGVSLSSGETRQTPAPGSTKFCSNCGQKIPAGASFCQHCGHKQ